MRLLLDRGANPDIQDNDGDTALIIASSRGYRKIVKLLLENGSNVDIINNKGYTALSLASSREYEDIVELLERHIMSTKLQKAYHKLAATHIRSLDNDSLKKVAEYLSKMPYNPEVAKRIKEKQYGGKKKTRKKKRKKTKKKTRKTRRKTRKKK